MAVAATVRMNTNLERFKRDLSKLMILGKEMNLDLTFRNRDETEETKKRTSRNRSKAQRHFREELPALVYRGVSSDQTASARLA